LASEDLLTPPGYCQYADGPCDQTFLRSEHRGPFFLYPSKPSQISATIEAAVAKASASRRPAWTTWRDLPTPGQLIFCEICKGTRYSSTVVADVTTLNFNVLFEIGFAIGLGVPVIPIRDTTYVVDKRQFEDLGVLATLGYIDFTNAEDLVTGVERRLPGTPLPSVQERQYSETPLYALKGPINTEGTVQLMATLKKSALRFRMHDPIETPRLSLSEARRQVAGSVGLVAHLLSPNRRGSTVHNALCALVSGIAMAQQKVVIMLQEEATTQPIDYRDVVVSYDTPSQIPRLLERPFRRVVENMQSVRGPDKKARKALLQELDLGDIAAENEIGGLRSYFVPTGQSTQAKQGHARLVIGRKGSGKSATFYEVRNSLARSHDRLVLDLKPEGHQFTRLREFVLDRMSPGLQEHTMVAFWTYTLLTEIARKIVENDETYARRDHRRMQRYDRVCRVYERHDPGRESDLSQRLLRQVERIGSQLGDIPVAEIGGRLTQIIYMGDIRELRESVVDYIRDKDAIWLLMDNLDKGWPLRGASSEDILIARALLEATRKLQQEFESHDVEFKCLLFLRSDIYEQLQKSTPDKGKDTAIRLDWDDPALFEEIVRRRIVTSTRLTGDFRRDIWPQICDSHIGAEDSFNYIIERTLMRPRDLLQFLNRAIEVAVNRGHSRIEGSDLLQAEKSYSEDVLLALSYEIQDTHPTYGDALYAFQGGPNKAPKDETKDVLLASVNIKESEADAVLEMLIWYGFLGVEASAFPEPKYSYTVHENVRRLLHPIETSDGVLVIHPAFRAALDTWG
jgi:hypothetical protein